jgi:hypothetical protein
MHDEKEEYRGPLGTSYLYHLWTAYEKSTLEKGLARPNR